MTARETMTKANPYAGLSSHAKGRQLEEDFARWMKSELGYDTARTRKQDGNSEIDIHAKRYTKRSKRLHAVGLWFFIMSALSFVFLQVDPQGTAQILAFLGKPASLPGMLFMIGAFGFAASVYGKTTDAHHAYVECKNLKGSAKKSYMHEFAHVSKNLTQKKGDRLAMFVSYNGFSRHAKDVARREGIICYRGGGDIFERVDL